MMRSKIRPVADVNPLAEKSLFDDASTARWRGFDVGCVRATPELVGRCGDDSDLLLAMLDTGHAQADFRFGSRWFRHELGAGDIGLFAPQGHADLTHWRCHDVRRIMVRISSSDLRDESLLKGLFNAPPRTTLVFKDPALAAVLRAMAAEITAGCPNGALFAESLSLGVAMHVQRRSLRAPVRERGRLTQAQVQRLDDLVRCRLAQGVSIAEMAECAGVSRAQLARLFKTTLGCTPYQYVLKIRLKVAIEQVQQGQLPLACVAQGAGFASQSHMTALFMKNLGLTPGALRKDLKGQPSPALLG
jgi:AraC family transcriptional regulator